MSLDMYITKHEKNKQYKDGYYQVCIFVGGELENYGFVIDIDNLIEKIKKNSILIKLNDDIENEVRTKWNNILNIPCNDISCEPVVSTPVLPVGNNEVLKINGIYEGDCLELMQRIPNKSIDMILCDLPYPIY